MAYTTLTEIKVYLGISSADSDTLLTSLISEGEALMSAEIGAEIEQKSVEEYYYSDGKFLLSALKASGITVSKDSETISHTLERFKDLYYIKCATGDVKVNYTSGYETVPTDLKMATKMVIADMYKVIDDDRLGLKQSAKSVGGASATEVYESAFRNDYVRAVIGKYRIPLN